MRKIASLLVVFVSAAVPAVGGAQTSDAVRVRAVARVVVQDPPKPPTPPTPPRVIVQRRESRDAREEQTEIIKKTVRIGNNGELEITNVAGNIEIKRGGGNEVTIEAVKIARARTVEEAKELLPLVSIDVTERAGRAEVRTSYPRHEQMLNTRRNINVHVNYTITAPAGTRVTARSISGHIKATDIAGELTLLTTSGDVQVVKARRVSAAKTTSGTVSISDIDSDGPIEAGSVSGGVVVNRVKAARLEVSTVTGNVVVQDVECGRIEAASFSGDVEFGGALLKGGRYELNSHSGNVRVALVGGSGFELEANSWSGHVQAAGFQIGEGVQQVSGRGPRRKELKGVVGDGSAILEITTFSGNVHITKK